MFILNVKKKYDTVDINWLQRLSIGEDIIADMDYKLVLCKQFFAITS